MGRYKQVDMSSRFLAVDLTRQILPGSFEFALSHLIDQLNLSAFHPRFRNDAVGAPAYAPAVLLKIVLLAYSKGIMHSRDIEAACVENIQFIAISGDSHPHFTTIAHFVATLGEPIAEVFAQVLTYYGLYAHACTKQLDAARAVHQQAPAFVPTAIQWQHYLARFVRASASTHCPHCGAALIRGALIAPLKRAPP
jgi:transposase